MSLRRECLPGQSSNGNSTPNSSLARLLLQGTPVSPMTPTPQYSPSPTQLVPRRGNPTAHQHLHWGTRRDKRSPPSLSLSLSLAPRASSSAPPLMRDSFTSLSGLSAVLSSSSSSRTPPLSPSPGAARADRVLSKSASLETPRATPTPAEAARRGSDGDDAPLAPPAQTNDVAAALANVEAQWNKKKAQWLAHFRTSGDVDEPAAEEDAKPLAAAVDDWKCHVCNASLGLLKRHRCRNCGLAVCGVHSKNQVPLPHLGIMKEARVCDICTRQLVQRRAGYRSPRPRKPRGSTSGDELQALVDMTPPVSPLEGSVRELLATSPKRKTSLRVPVVASPMQHPLEAKDSGLLGSSSGVLYSCLLEEQGNIVDEILYLGTFTMGGRALASRHFNGNVAIWKDRWFMLTSAEMLCFKASDSDEKVAGSVAALGELRSAVHLTDILHIEVNDQYPRILTVIRSDGRVFRVRAKTPEQCQEITIALRKAQKLFQDAMHKLQRGVRPEDYSISCVTIQHESSLVEHVVSSSPLLEEKMQVEMYPSSILRFYVNGPEANGVAQFSCQMLLSSLRYDDKSVEPRQLIVSEADPLRSSPSDSKVLRVSLRPSRVSSSTQEVKDQRTRAFWSSMAALIAAGAYLNLRQWTFLEVMVWLTVLVSWLTRFHDPVLLLLTTRRINHAKRFCVECVDITYGRKAFGGDGDDDDIEGEDGEMEVDPRFVEGCNGDVEEAKVRYAETLKWRQDEEVDKILLQPLPQFAPMKASYTHFAHKKDKQGHIITVDHFGYMKKMREEFLSRGVTEDQAVRHQIFLQEYLWNVIDPRPFPGGNTLKIFDIKGISMGDVSGDVFNFMKRLGMTIAEYNPERIYKVFIVNPPSWFNLIWKLVSPSINPKTRERIHVVRGQKEIAKALLEFVHEDDLPVEYGGKCCCPGGCFTDSPEERDLRNFVENVLNSMEEGDPRIQEALDALKTKYHQQLVPYEAAASSAIAASSSSKE